MLILTVVLKALIVTLIIVLSHKIYSHLENVEFPQIEENPYSAEELKEKYQFGVVIFTLLVIFFIFAF